MQGSSLECNIPGIPYDMNEKQRRWPLANAIAHKRQIKGAALQQINWHKQTSITEKHCVSLYND